MPSHNGKHYSGKHYPSEMDKIIMDELDDFVGVCVTDLQEASITAAKYAVKELKAKSPKGMSGAYAKGWRQEPVKYRTGVKTTVYNKDRYMLAHLLEHGHAKVTGGRTQPQIHIAPIEKEAGDKFEEEVKRRIENGN